MSVDLYKKVPVKVQKKSGFDKSFQNLFTSKVGTITPILVDELIPNSTVNLEAAISAALPPLASDTFMRCTLKYASFFVPTRLLVNGYESWLTGKDNIKGNTTVSGASVEMPVLKLTMKNAMPGSLADFLGVKSTISYASGNDAQITVSALPFLAYHRIYDDWFRNSQIQTPVFIDNSLPNTVRVYNAVNSKWLSPLVYSSSGTYTDSKTLDDTVTTSLSSKSCILGDGVKLTDLRQANFGIDLFTSCTPNPQNGNAQSVSFTIAGSADEDGDVTGQGNFTISALRAANSMQQFLERNNLAGNRLVDYVKAQYGANLSDGIAQRPLLLGSGSFDVYNKGIYQTVTAGTDETVPMGNNPFNVVGAKYGSASAEGTSKLVNNFTTAEPGYLMVLAWLSPKVTYSSGIDPIMTRYISNGSQSDMANPILQNVGNEPIFQSQLNVQKYYQAPKDVFGYNERYCQWKDKMDELHGLMRDGSSLDAFALQRTFGATPGAISTNFLQIPVTFMDQVAAVDQSISDYGYWCDTYFKYGVSMPLAKYAVPSLQDPAYEHGEDVVIDRNGKQLS